MRIPREFIRTLVERADVADIVGERVQLKRRGNNWFGLCPFHTEKTPSFSVNPERGFYHCFGCGAHGTALDFIVKTECAGDFIAGVETLAKRMGMDIPREKGAGGGGSEKAAADMAGLLQAALGRWRRLLSETPQAREYLKGRGMTGETAARFSLGFAADDWRGLEGFLPDYNSDLVVRAGLVRVREKEGRRYDYFRGRVMFPIFTSPTRLVGFGGRALGDEEPKYLNSPESPLFAKGRTLFGLPQASDFARRRNRLIVCEGYMDAVMLSQAGFGESVATMGTAATAPQMEKAARAADNVIFAFDGDNAGRAAAWRALEGILPALRDGKGVSFLFLPAGEDPDSFIQKKGAGAFESLLGNAKSLGDYAVERLLENTGAETDEGRRSAAARGAAALLAKVHGERAPFLRDILQKTFAKRIGLDPGLLTRQAAARADSERTRTAQRIGANRRGGFRMRTGAMLTLLCCLYARPELGLTLDESPPLPGVEGEAEAVEVVLSRLRFRGADSEGEEREGSEMNVAQWLEEKGFSGVAQQVILESRRFVIGEANPEGDFYEALRALKRRHLERIRAGMNVWLEPIKGNTDANTNEGDTVLHHVAATNTPEALERAKLLIEGGAEVNAKNEDGATPLHSAALRNAPILAQLLIEHGADVNMKSKSGATPLHSTVFMNSLETAKLLIERGAEVNAKDNDGRTPMDFAISYKNDEMQSLLKRHGGCCER